MSKLLKEAIADAKAVRETALQNAKAVLEEAFTPKLQSMLSQRLQQEMVEDEAEAPVNPTAPVDPTAPVEDEETIDEMHSPEYPEHTTDPQGPKSELTDGPSDTDQTSTPNGSDNIKAGGKLDTSDTDQSDVGPGKNIALSDTDTDQTKALSESEVIDEDSELNMIIAELEQDMEEEPSFGGEEEMDYSDEEGEEMEAPEGEEMEAPIGDDEEIEIDIEDDEMEAPEGEEMEASEMEPEGEVDLEEILREMELAETEDFEPDEPVDGKEVAALRLENSKLKREKGELLKGIGFVKGKLNEVNMLNAKLLYTNKVFKSYGLNNDQKMRVVESFDRAISVREVKLTYANLCESFKIVNGNKRKSSITEGVASRAIGGTKPSPKTVAKQKQILSEGNVLSNRFQKLAGITKK